MIFKVWNSWQIQVGYIWTSFTEKHDIVSDESLLAVCQCEMSQLGKADALESLKPSKVSFVKLELLQWVAVHPKVVSYIHIRQLVSVHYLRQVRHRRYQFDDCNLLGFKSCLNRCECFAEDGVELSVDLAEVDGFSGWEELIYQGQKELYISVWWRAILK